ncbi:aspartate/glutamate racemase family protein [Falsiroseomonas sp.]|uniref:maleate cis-trans isomerase family protein n=1 Tax=Falsiroseomonas sp. TaxID=2870721 RepID=UPI00272AA62B|nr:aspartate/glutamate racemase family protein [Falsiroseomonas sp.]
MNAEILMPDSLMPEAPRLLASILPSANTVVERTTQALLRDLPGVVPIFTRVAKRGAVDPFPDSYDWDAMMQAAELLADAKPDAIIWSASKGAVIGLEHDRALVRRVRDATGLPCATSGLALLRALELLGATRVALIGPHTAEYNRRAARGLAAEGVEMVAEASLGITDNLAFASVGYGAVAALARQVARPGVQAIILWNTNCAGAPLAAALEAETGIPLLDATALGVWGGLGAAGIPETPGRGWGRLFTLPAKGSG